MNEVKLFLMNYALQEDVLEFFQREFPDFLALMGE